MFRVLVLLSAFAFMAGCGDGGPSMGKVSGTVTLDGKPMPKLRVSFSPEGGGASAVGTTNSDGHYELVCLNKKGAPIGLHKVSITTVREVSSSTTMGSSTDASGGESYENQGAASSYSKADLKPNAGEKVPARYNRDTELLEEVEAGDNEINFDLKSK
ncbi:MAG: carboxypeptidase regulatory-like domain-containing protein [Planctomycetales bacterium]|nr:carboxypeptidase regulatory-like domain-containing protein [Planctomycetales bacterium]